MDGQIDSASDFEAHRNRLRSIAYRMLGSLSEADDAVQDTWLRLQRVNPNDIDDLGSWLTRVVGRICLDRLTSARARREMYVGDWLPEPLVGHETATDPAEQVTLDESVAAALLLVLESLTPAERTAFVLHDVFALPFDEIGIVVGRSASAVRQLASRARRRVKTRRPRFDTDMVQQHVVITAFLRAARDGDLEGLIRVLDPDVVWHSDAGGQLPAPRRPVRGAKTVAAMVLRQGATYAANARIVTVNGSPGVKVTDGERLQAVIAFTVTGGRIAGVYAVYNPDKLQHVRIS